MPTRVLPLLAVVAALICGGAAEKPGASAAAPKSDAKADAKKDTKADAKADAKKDAPPACMHCGATCGLRPVCLCEPGTKKQPKNEFETTCEPICIPGCGALPWHGTPRPGCTDGCGDADCCRSRMRYCKRLKKETVDEEKPVIERKIAHVCDLCRGAGAAGCCGGESPRPRRGWWPSPPWWWPRPAGQ